ncbi:MAG: type II secretion system F family protein [Gemmatimonadaceae bacterium]
MSPTLSYRYRAARPDGSLELGVLDATSRESASGLLATRGLFPVEIVEQAAEEGRKLRMSAADLALGLRVLGDLLESGLPISRALAALDELAPPAWKPLLAVVRQQVREGKGLATSLAVAPVQIPTLVIGIVQAGEAGSGLATAVRRSADLMEETAATRAALRNALAYPIVLASAGAGSIGLLVGVVLPKFASILADLGQALPPTTRLVLGVAAFVRAAAIPALAAGAIGGVVWYRWVSTPTGRRSWDSVLLDLPALGSVRRAAATSRTMGAFAALLEGGVPIATAMHHAAGAAGDAAISARLLAARDSVIHGGRISRALAEHEAATPTAIRLVRAGEESGRLAPMLAHAAKLERERAAQAVKSAVRLIEPGMILIFGGIVALVAASLLQAIYSVRPQ